MMKRLIGFALACAMVFAVASIAAAQKAPTPVVRMGPWVEIDKDTWMNIIANSDIRYRTWHNSDFEDDIQDRTMTRNLSGSSVSYGGEGDFLEAELRFGVDMRHKKTLKMRIMFETQSLFDGNKIDDRQNNTTPSGANSFGTATGEDNSPHVERFWIDYSFPGTPLRMRVGSDLWFTDAAGVLGDDDPRFAVFLKPMPNLQLQFAAVIQTEAARSGMTNDNDDVYYTFGADYDVKPHRFYFHGAYFRWRFNTGPEDIDSVLLMAGWKGTVGIVKALVQPMAVFGTANGTGGEDYDIAAFGIIAHAEANLGMLRPFIGLAIGSGDDDPADTDLQGFNSLPQREIMLVSRTFTYLGAAPSQSQWGPSAAARAAIGGGNIGRHTTGNIMNDRLGNTAHSGITTAYSNPGTLVIPVGVHIVPLKGHTITFYYMYVGITDDETLVALNAAGVAAGTQLALKDGNVGNALYHEVSAQWFWKVNKHFDIRIYGAIMIPAEGAKDIASTVDCDPTAAVRPCEGEDIAINGEARFRARF